MRPDRGAAPVARLSDLPEGEVWTIAALRLWSEEEAGGNEAFNAVIAGRIGAARGARFASLFGDLMALMAAHARRPMQRHKPACSCVGADEAVFANFIATASQGAREDAMLIATLLLRPDVAPIAASLAQTLGLELLRGLGPPRSATLH